MSSFLSSESDFQSVTLVWLRALLSRRGESGLKSGCAEAYDSLDNAKNGLGQNKAAIENA